MEALIEQRTAQKKTIDRLERYLNRNKDKEVIVVEDYLSRRDWLIEAFNKYNKVQDKIDYMKDENPDDLDTENREEMETKYCQCLSEIKNKISQYNSKQKGINSTASVTLSEDKMHVKLPELNIPIFSGDIANWIPFFELFSTLIIENKNLTEIQKFIYLKSFLRQEPLNLINSLPLISSNFQIAIDTLRDRYENRLLIINSHIRSLLDTPPLSRYSVFQLREFITRIKQHIESLKNLKMPVENWDILLIYIFSQKLDYNTRKAFEIDRDTDELPTLKEFFYFLEKRCVILENLSSADNSKSKNVKLSHYSGEFSSKSHETENCLFCNLKNHSVYKCYKFKNISLKDRIQFVKEKTLCFNCLGNKHLTINCKSQGCTICKRSHHTLLHDFSYNNPSSSFSNPSSRNPVCPNKETSKNIHSSSQFSSLPCSNGNQETSICSQSASAHKDNFQVLLATVCVKVYTKNGDVTKARALLDSGSQSSFITENFAQKLNLPSYPKIVEISGISNNSTLINKMVNITFYGEGRNQNFNVTCYVLKNITCNLPQCKIDVKRLQIPHNIQLADPDFATPSNIDLLLGCDIYHSLIAPDIIKLGKNAPILQKTELGWVLMGPIYKTCLSLDATHSFTSHLTTSEKENLNNIIQNFWLTEEIDVPYTSSSNDELAEKIFKDTTKVLPNGQFQVDMPLKTDIPMLGESFSSAKKRFHSLESRLQRNSNLFHMYKKFIDEYIELGHARFVQLEKYTESHDNKYFLPHHCVLKDSISGVKIRVVFDGSMKTSSGISLNDLMLKGYPVQSDLFDILCRFRTFIYVFVTDIEKMFRNIEINPRQRHLQNILWRDHPNEEIKCIELCTVTYGIKSSPFLATRVLKELASKNENTHPLAYRCITKQCYMDDFICGANSLEDLKQIYEELYDLCNSAHFSLHKWKSNSKEFLKFFNDSQQHNNDNYNIEITDSVNKVLGLMWNPKKDNFLIVIPEFENKHVPTKRDVLSAIAQVFDPLGLIAPFVIKLKIFMQKTWSSNIDWDEELNSELLNDWRTNLKGIEHLKHLEIPRSICLNIPVFRVELVGYCDASTRAFGCCIYLRVIYTNSTISTRLVCAKSKVAPLKSLTLPKLELNAALLLSRLIDKIINIYDNLKIDGTFLFSDSEIALAWISSHPSRWSAFVANRVAIIQELTSNCRWSHVRSAQNPADLVSRGLSPKDLINSTIWWTGPKLLSNYNMNLYDLKFTPRSKDLPEQRKITMHDLDSQSESYLEKLSKSFSKFSRFHRTMAYCFRFYNNCRLQEKIEGPLKVYELQDCLASIIKIIQRAHFSNIFSHLKGGLDVHNRNIIKLSPFLDSNDIIRVGGRLSLSNLPFDQKHPILLPSHNNIVNLMLKLEHEKLLHAGPQTVLSNFRLKFWPLNGLKETKRIINKCITCYRFRAKNAQQIMADLPKVRVSAARVFSQVGLDYGGPFSIKGSNLRKAPTMRCYICIIVCMATKAIHIELVSDLTTDAFISALKRFISRRGCPVCIYSDNATNFLGASNVLKSLYDFFNVKDNVNVLQDYLTTRAIQWKFIPPHSPHWGGLWEAAIKSAKHHLYRIVGNASLTFEELYTVLTQIEAVLNSRPLCPLSNDPTDLCCLTPGHFLIGAPLTAYPDKDISTTPINRLSRWQLCTKLQQDFWKRWSVEYLNNLQNKPKWLKPNANLKVNDLVLVKDNNSPPLNWCRARILNVYPGPDNRVRVVELKTKDGVFTRPISKVCPLPVTTDT